MPKRPLLTALIGLAAAAGCDAAGSCRGVADAEHEDGASEAPMDGADAGADAGPGYDGAADDDVSADAAVADVAGAEAAVAADANADTLLDGAGGLEWDLRTAFSPSQNPNGPWRFGYSSATSPVPSAFELDTFTNGGPVVFWHPSGDAASYYPYVAANTDAVTRADPTNSWAVRPGEVAMEGGPTGQYSVVQFTVPLTATYDIQADFAGIHFRLSTTDVHVLHGAGALFDADIDGYGGDPAFHEVQGQNPQASYHATQSLVTGDTLSFAVGFGANGTFTNDTTGLFVHLKATDVAGPCSAAPCR